MLFLYDCQDVCILADEIFRGAHVRDRPTIGIDPCAGMNADNNTCADGNALARRRAPVDHLAAQGRMPFLRITGDEDRTNTLGFRALEQNEIE